MSEDEFEAELQFATSMREEPDSLYWGGYRRGLLRARYGKRVCSSDNHSAWRAFKEDDDPLLAELGRGYVDGVNTVITGQQPRSALVRSQLVPQAAGGSILSGGVHRDL